ncbi:MAG: LacI family transcriptional regulator [Acidaminococcaceae bacterium]|jgi:LacI family transcriptional regulator|nr:LacI family transcriptional regulator [Acidaminococcaceae bacterium]
MTIYDIARACDVSIATVSRVLNGSNKVRPLTRAKVLAAMRAQNYTPNPFARGLGLDSMKMVGILCTDIADAFFAKAVSLVEPTLRARGFDVILGCTGNDLEDKKKYLQLFLDKHVDAIVLIGSSYRETLDNSHLASAANKVPIITINCPITLPNVYSVVCDEASGFCASAQVLERQGCHSILYLYDRLTYSGQQKLQGFRDGLKKAGLQENPQLILMVDRTLDAAQSVVERLLAQKVHFDAILASEDIVAVGAQKALVARGLSLPVIGCNNSILASCSTPSLTSLDNRLEALCPAAISVLVDVLEGKGDMTPSLTTFAPFLVYRDSFKK